MDLFAATLTPAPATVPAAGAAAAAGTGRPCAGCQTQTAFEDLVEAHYGYAQRNWLHADAVVWLCRGCREPNTAAAKAPAVALTRLPKQPGQPAAHPPGASPRRRPRGAGGQTSVGRR